MGLTVTVTNEAFPPDTEFEISGVGLVVNGQPTELTEDQERAFIARNGVSLVDATGEGEASTVTGSASVTVEDVIPSDISDTAPYNPEYGKTEEEVAPTEPTPVVDVPMSTASIGGES